jgi:type IV pilus assembly protein PilO
MNLDEQIEQLTKVPKNQRMAGYFGSYILCFVVYFFMWLSPNQDQRSNFENQIRTKEQDLSMVQDQVGTKDELKKKAQALTSKLRLAQKELPQGTEIPDLIRTISETGRKVGLEIKKFEPKQEITSSTNDFVAEVPITLAVQGTFHQVAMFFDRLSKMDRIVHVKNIDIEIAEEENTNVSLLVEGSAITFRFLTDEERDRKKKKKKGRRK